MSENQCAFCHEEIEGEPIRRGERLYCSEACAFEDLRSADCSGRPDSNIASPVVQKDWPTQPAPAA